MARQRENDEVERDIAAAFESVSRLRPSHRIVRMWRDLEACLENIRRVEFLLGYAPEKPTHVNHEFVQIQLQDARAALGALALALSDEANS